MDVALGETVATLRATVRKVRRRNLTFVAGSLAYNAFVSLIPLLVLLLLAAGTIGDARLAGRLSSLTQSVLTPEAQDLVADALTNTSGQTGLSVAGVLVLLWGALKLFRGLNTAFAEVYDTTDEVSFIGQVRDAFLAFLVVVVSLLAVGLAAGAFAYFDYPFLGVLNPLLLLCALSLAFFPMYYVFPHVDMSPREALPGAVVAAGGWAILEVGFQIYAANAGKYEAYGVIGGVLLLVTWLYFSGLVLLIGAAVNAVIWERNRAVADPLTTGPSERAGGDTATPGNATDRHERTGSTPPDDAGESIAPATRDAPADRGAAANRVADVAPMGTGGPRSSAERSPNRDRGPRPRPSNAQSFSLGVAVGVVGCLAVLATAIWQWFD